MKKKIGIFTLHRALNYGAVWQCWALKHSCEKLGYDVETIDFNPYGHYTYQGFLRHRPDKAISYVLNFWNFNRFVSEKLNPTVHTEDHDWITKNAPKDDIYIVGSDTVWCESVVGEFLNSYMLDFAPNDVKRISYAASQGGGFAQSLIFRDEIKKFSAVSLREPQFITETSEVYGGDVVDVCDPSLLLTKEEYQKEEKKKWRLPKHYIALFDLAGDSAVVNAAKMMRSKTGLPIVNLVGRWLRDANRNYFSITPEEWLYMIHNADYVCTNSFHGTAFAIIYRRPFITVAATQGGRAKTNGRAENLLTQCGLIDRYVTDLSQLDSLKDIDFAKAEPQIEAYRNRSFEWLKQALKK